MARSSYQNNKQIRDLRMEDELVVTLRFPAYREGLEALHASGEGIRFMGDAVRRAEQG